MQAQIYMSLQTLSTLSKSRKTIPTSVEFVDIAGLVKGASEGQGLGNKFLANIRECDSIVQVGCLLGRRCRPAYGRGVVCERRLTGGRGMRASVAALHSRGAPVIGANSADGAPGPAGLGSRQQWGAVMHCINGLLQKAVLVLLLLRHSSVVVVS